MDFFFTLNQSEKVSIFQSTFLIITTFVPEPQPNVLCQLLKEFLTT